MLGSFDRICLRKAETSKFTFFNERFLHKKLKNARNYVLKNMSERRTLKTIISEHKTAFLIIFILIIGGSFGTFFIFDIL
jgi:hypothetical protein